MPNGRHDQPLASSVLDRLVKRNEPSPAGPAFNRNQVLRDLKQSVGRDLSDLLNTRARCEFLPAGCDALSDSLVGYGLPEFAHARAAEFQELVKEVITRYEPRLRNVRVQVVRNADSADRTLRFHITASLNVEPALEPLVFESQRDPVTGAIEVKVEGQ